MAESGLVETPNFLSSEVSYPQEDNENVVFIADPIALDIPDEDLVDIFDKRLSDEREFYKAKYDLYERRKKNELYRFGRQIAELDKAGDLKDYESRNMDNVLYEIEATVKPLAMSQLPDLIVTPGNQEVGSQDIAKLLSKAVDSDVKKRENRRVLGLSFVHRPVYFVGIIKAIWNPEAQGGMGDYEFQVIHPDFVDFDYTSTEPNADKMEWISQAVPITVEQVLMRFPKAKKEFVEQLKRDGLVAKGKGEPSWKELASEIRIREVWFTWYKKIEGEENKWERIEGVLWKYKDVILDKMRNPNFDYEGNEQLFTYDQPNMESSKRPLTLDEMQMSMVTGQFPENLAKQKVYNNYFKMPRKPYYFVTYDQWGKQPLDETTSLEQNLKNQKILDTRLKQIDETLNERGHHIWSKESGLKPSDVEKMDHNNPDEDYMVDGNVANVHKFLEPARPSAQEFQDVGDIRSRMYSISGANAVRGQLQSDVATTNQIAREADYTRADDLVDETINAAAEWMAQWALQFIKLRYTQEHFRWLMGEKGEMVYMRLHQNLIQEGMVVMIKASGTDRIKKQNNAMDMAKMQLIDPLSFYQDMGMDDPEGRTARLLMFQTNPSAYLAAFVESSGEVSDDLIQKLQSMQVQPGAMGGAAPAPGGAPQQPTPGDTGAVPAQPQPGVQASPTQAPAPLV